MPLEGASINISHLLSLSKKAQEKNRLIRKEITPNKR